MYILFTTINWCRALHMGRSSIIVYWFREWHHCSISLMSLLCVLVLVTKYQLGPRRLPKSLPGYLLEFQSLVHWVWSFLPLWSFYRVGVKPVAGSASQLSLRPISAQIVKVWLDSISSVTEFLLERNYVSSFMNCPTIDHLPRLPYFIYYLIPWDYISTAGPMHFHPPDTSISYMLSSIQVPAAPGGYDLFTSLSHLLLWLGTSCHKLPELWRKSSGQTSWALEGSLPYILRSHFCHQLTIGQMLMNNDNCFFCRLVSFTCDWNVKQSWAEGGTRNFASAHCSPLRWNEKTKVVWNPWARTFQPHCLYNQRK